MTDDKTLIERARKADPFYRTITSELANRLEALTAPVTVTDANVKRASWEFLLDRGMQPWHVTRRGAELWEDYAPAMRAALEAALSPQEPEGVNGAVDYEALGRAEADAAGVGAGADITVPPTPQEPVAGNLEVVAWQHPIRMGDDDITGWAVTTSTPNLMAQPSWEPLTDHTEATRIIRALEAERDELDFLLYEGGSWEAQLRSAENRAEKAEALIAELVEGLEIAREQVLAVCEHNERVNNGARSEMDRNDLERIDVLIAKARAS